MSKAQAIPTDEQFEKWYREDKARANLEKAIQEIEGGAGANSLDKVYAALDRLRKVCKSPSAREGRP